MDRKAENPDPSTALRESRVAAALRDNLRKRKAQQQTRAAHNPTDKDQN